MSVYVDLIWCHRCQCEVDHYRHELDGLMCDVCDEPAVLPVSPVRVPVVVAS